mgnify:CR=1 FL=1
MLRSKLKILFLIYLIVILLLPATANEVNNFTEILNEHRMIFCMPKDYEQTKVVKNDDVAYQFAIKSKKIKLEIRYAVFSLKEQLKEYEKWKNNRNKNGVKKDPNQLYNDFTLAIVENIAGSKEYYETKFQNKNVKIEFDADWGSSYVVNCKSSFGAGYKYASITALHKDNVADAYIIFLFDDYKTVLSEIIDEFHNMRFLPDHFNTRSIFYSAAYNLSIITKTQITPQEIEKKINYKATDNLTIDDYLIKIAQKYSLKLEKLNLQEIKDVAKVVNQMNENNVTIIIYGNQMVNHSAVAFGYKPISGNLIFRIWDPVFKDEDFMDASILKSNHWRLIVDRAYYLSK